MLDLASSTTVLQVTAFAKSEIGRILATLIVFWLSAASVGFLQRRAVTRCLDEQEFARRRANFVLVKNLILAGAMVALSIIWASKIAGVALSVAAVAGAMLIVSKDFLASLLGTAVFAITRPYRVGDFIEIDGVSGRVVDTSMLNTTVADTSEGNLITGANVILPHAMLLSMPVKNLTATGQYVLCLLPVSVPHRELVHCETSLLKAAQEVCGEWIDEASQHLKRMESREMIDLPSGNPKVVMDLSKHDHAGLTLRYACRPDERINVEQAILRRYLTLIGQGAHDASNAARPSVSRIESAAR